MTVMAFLFLLQCLPETYLRSPIDLHAELAERFHSFSFARILRECCGSGYVYTSIQDRAPLLPPSGVLNNNDRNHDSEIAKSNSGIYMSTSSTMTSSTSLSQSKPPMYTKLHDQIDS